MKEPNAHRIILQQSPGFQPYPGEGSANPSTRLTKTAPGSGMNSASARSSPAIPLIWARFTVSRKAEIHQQTCCHSFWIFLHLSFLTLAGLVVWHSSGRTEANCKLQETLCKAPTCTPTKSYSIVSVLSTAPGPPPQGGDAVPPPPDLGAVLKSKPPPSDSLNNSECTLCLSELLFLNCLLAGIIIFSNQSLSIWLFGLGIISVCLYKRYQIHPSPAT